MSITNHTIKQCSNCKIEFPATSEYFFRNKNSYDGWHTWCKTCNHIKRGHKKTITRWNASLAERVWSRVAITANPDKCWMWQASVDSQGYGHFTDHRKHWLSHRAVYTVIYGEIPDGLDVCHRCDTPGCCNPSHLWLGTRHDNNRDRDGKGRNGDIRGELNGNARLTETDVLDILSLCKQGVKNVEIARQYRVSPGLISLIKTGKAWSHIK